MKKLIFGMAATLVLVAQTFAHHSFAMFEGNKLTILRGTLISFTNMNPHAWISVMAQVDGKGKFERWDVESTAPIMLAVMGISAKTLLPGQKVTLGIRPLRDGRKGGSMVFVITPDGVSHGAKPADLGLDVMTLKP